MAKSDLFPALEDIEFASKDPDQITRETVALYEASTGRTLSRADPVRLFLDSIILTTIHQRNLIDTAAKMNLLAYATGTYLDHIGALLGVSRLSATHAATQIRFTLHESRLFESVIPAGTRVRGGDMYFSTTSELVLRPGTLSGIVPALCSVAGTTGNGYLPSQINKLADALPFRVMCVNITESSGGTDEESDEAFRERIQIAPESFSVAGPKKAYEYHARSADDDIIAVAVMGPPDTAPGHVDIYPLLTGGTLPSDETLSRVYEACNASNIRPDTDYVSVKRPEVISYSTKVKYWVSSTDSSREDYICSAVDLAVRDWELWQRSSLGRDINPSELVHRVHKAGAKRCEVISPSFRVLHEYEVALSTGLSIEYGGLEDD